MRLSSIIPLLIASAMGPVLHGEDDLQAPLQELKTRTVDILRAAGASPANAAQSLASQDNACARLLESEPEPVIWGGFDDLDIDLRLAAFCSDILDLARAYRCPASRYFGDPDVRKRIVHDLYHAMETFDPAIPRLKGSGFARWRLSIPHALSATALLMEEELDIGLLIRIRNALRFQLGKMDLVGANAAWEARNNIYLALLDNDPQRLAEAARHMFESVRYSTGSGVREDYGYVFHGRIPYAGGYGAGFAQTTAEFLYLLNGTPWAPIPAKQELVARLLLEHSLWFLEGSETDLLILGRGYRHNQRSSWQGIASAVLCLTQVDTPVKEQLQSAAAALLATGWKPGLAWSGLATELSAQAPGLPKGFRYWYSAEMGAFNGEGYHVGFRQFSERVQDYEYLTQNGRDGWNLAYGFANVIRQDGIGSWYDDKGRLRDSVDLEYLPAATTRIGGQPVNPLMPRVDNFGYSLNYGISPVAGGAGDASGGAAGFVLMPVYGQYHARKSLHFFAEGFWALGSGITSLAGPEESRPVVTTVLQRHVEADRPELLVNGEQVAIPPAQRILEEVKWLWVDGTAVVMESPARLNFRMRDSMLTVWIDHGADPREAGYAFAVLPMASQSAAAEFARDMPVRPLRAHPEIHVVRDEARDNDSMVFFSPLPFRGYQPNQPFVLYRNGGPAGSVYSVQDPLHLLASQRFSGPVKLKIPELDRIVSPDAAVHPQNAAQGLPTQSNQPLVVPVGRPGHLTIDSTLGRIYRFGNGAAGEAAKSVPREDLEEFHLFRVSATSDARVTILEVTLPERALREEFTLSLHAYKGQKFLELEEKELIERLPENRFRYRWDRAATVDHAGRPCDRPGVNQDYRIYLTTEMWQAVGYFNVPAYDEAGALMIPAREYLSDRNNPNKVTPPALFRDRFPEFREPDSSAARPDQN